MDWLKNLSIAVIASAVGIVGTWYFTSARPTVLAYVATTTSTGTDSTARSLIPDLAIRIGDETIPSIHTHAIELFVRGTYLESAPVAITFPDDVRFFGSSFQAPSSLQSITCSELPKGLKCELSKLDPAQTAPFRITVATQLPSPPTIGTAGPTLSAQRLQDLQSFPSTQGMVGVGVIRSRGQVDYAA